MLDRGQGKYSFDTEVEQRLGFRTLDTKQRRKSLVKKDNFLVRFEVTNEPENILLPAIKGVTLGEALDALLRRRGLFADDISAYLDFSCTALSLSADTFHLGGASLRITGRDGGPKKPIGSLTSSASLKEHRTQNIWSNSECPYRKSGRSSSSKGASSSVLVGRSLSSSASMPAGSLMRRGSSWLPHHPLPLQQQQSPDSPAIGLSLTGYSEDFEMAASAAGGSCNGGSGSLVSGSSSILSRRRPTATSVVYPTASATSALTLSGSSTGSSANYPVLGDGDTGAAIDVSPSSTISRNSRASHRVTSSRQSSAFFSHGAKDKDRLYACLETWSTGGLPTMPDTHSLCLQQRQQGAAVLDMEEHWTALVDNGDLTQKQKDLQEALWELLYTEAEYIRSLNVINDLFVSCLLHLQSEQLLTDISVEQLFSNIADITCTNASFWESHLLPMLRSSRGSRCQLDVRWLKPAFSKFSETFAAYTKYCIEYSSCSAYMKKTEKENELFRAFVSWAEAQKQCNRLKLHDLLVKPMQRLTRYSLLLRAVVKKAEESDVKADLEQTVDHVDRFVKQVNEALHQKHEDDKLRSLAAKIEAYDAVDMPYSDPDLAKLLTDHLIFDLRTPIPGCGECRRHLLHEGPLKMKDSNTKQDVYCFLFTDLFLVTKANKRTDTVKIIKAPIMVDRLIAKEHSKDGNTYLLLLHMCEYGVAQAAYAFHGDNIPKWSEMIAKAQDVLAKVRANRLEDVQGAGDKQVTLEDIDAADSDVSSDLRRVSSSASNFDALVAGGDMTASVDSLSSCGTDAEEVAVLNAAAAVAGSMPVSPRQPARSCSDQSLSAYAVDSGLNHCRGRQLAPSGPRPSMLAVPSILADAASPSSSKGCRCCSAASPGIAVADWCSPLAKSPNRTASPGPADQPSEGDISARTCWSETGERSEQRHSPQPAATDCRLGEANRSVPFTEAAATTTPGAVPACYHEPRAERPAGSGGSRRRAGYERRYRTADAIEELRAGAKDSAIHKRLSWNLGSAAPVAAEERGFFRKSNRTTSADSIRSSTSGVSSTTSAVSRLSPDDATDIYEEGEEYAELEEEELEEAAVATAEESDDRENTYSEIGQFEFHHATDSDAETTRCHDEGWAAAMQEARAAALRSGQSDEGCELRPGSVNCRNGSRDVDDGEDDLDEARSRVEEAEEAAVRNIRNAPSSVHGAVGRRGKQRDLGLLNHSSCGSSATAGVVSADSVAAGHKRLPQGCTAIASGDAGRRLTQAELVRMRNRLLLSNAHDAAEV